MPAGRPQIAIDKKQFESLCGLQCTIQEMCCFFDCSEETINRWCRRTYFQTDENGDLILDDEGQSIGLNFAAVFAIKRGNGQISLRRTQFQLSRKSAAMAIFLGKNLLGQSDKVVHITSERDRQELREIFESVGGNGQQETE